MIPKKSLQGLTSKNTHPDEYPEESFLAIAKPRVAVPIFFVAFLNFDGFLIFS
jgi:hypothetical protein